MLLILLHSCWSARGSGFSRTRKGKWRTHTKCLFFFPTSSKAMAYWQTSSTLYESLFSWRDTKPPSKPTTGELDLHHTSRYSSDIFLLRTKMYRSSSSSSGTRVGGPSIKDLDLVWGRELRSGFLLKAHLGEERLGSRFGPCWSLKASNETGENTDSSCPYWIPPLKMPSSCLFQRHIYACPNQKTQGKKILSKSILSILLVTEE